MDLKMQLITVCAASGGSMLLWKLLTILWKRRNSETSDAHPPGFTKFQAHSVTVFLLAMGANWFFGPHLMDLYDSYGENWGTEADVKFYKSLLLSVGFITAALSGLVIGNLADGVGRRNSCILYAICYGITIVCHHFSDLWVLYIGRAFAGVATALLYCVFESWMITAHNEGGYPGHLLGETFNLAWGLNYPVAILVGVLCDLVTSKLPQGKVGDFDAAALLLGIMVIVIIFFWKENYGQQTQSMAANFKAGFRAFSTWNVLIISVIMTFFEGSMFVFVRFWWDLLAETEKEGTIQNGGIIFAIFMIFCMAGTELLLFLKKILSNKWIAACNCALAGMSLFACTYLSSFEKNSARFYAQLMCLCVYELCVGLHFSNLTEIRFELVDDDVRSTVTALCRVPVNFIVVTLLLLDWSWQTQFYILTGFNLLAALAAPLIRDLSPPEKEETAQEVGTTLEVVEIASEKKL